MTDIFRTWLDRVEQERIGHHQVIQRKDAPPLWWRMNERRAA